MTRLRIGIAVISCMFAAGVSLADDPAGVREATQAMDMIAREVGAGASMASKAAADALLAPSNSRYFAKSNAKDVLTQRSDSVGGSAAILAAGGAIKDKDAEVPLPVRKPKPVYKAGVKTYEAAGAKSADDPALGASKDKSGTETKGKTSPPQAPVDAAKGTVDAKADGKDKAGAKKDIAAWPALDIELAKARCTQLLKGIDAVVVAEAPFRSGECGAPAPVRLVSIGKDPEVALSPPALVTCDMVAALHKWIKGDLQPLARKHLAADIVRIETMSDYSCRRAYGRTANRLSEHGKANALDIRGFVTAKAQIATILDEWGSTRRDVLSRQIAAAKARAAQEDAARLAADKKAQENLRDPKAAPGGEKEPMAPATNGFASGAPGGGLAKTTIIDGLPKLTVTLPGGKSEGKSASGDSALGLAPQRLGGPKDDGSESKAQAPETEKKVPDAGVKMFEKSRRSKSSALEAIPYPAAKTSTSRFLHEAHIAACRIFGTTLGPEANEAHRNHFHVDMAERKVTKICE